MIFRQFYTSQFNLNDFRWFSSEEVEHRLERECGQIYSPIKNHPFFQQQPQIQSQSYNSHQSHRDQQGQHTHQKQLKSQPNQTQAKTSTSQHQQQQAKKGSGI